MKFAVGQTVTNHRYTDIRVTIACPKPDKNGNIVIQHGNGTYAVRPEAHFIPVYPLTAKSATQTNP